MNKEKYIKELESTIITRNPIKLIKFAKKYNPDVYIPPMKIVKASMHKLIVARKLDGWEDSAVWFKLHGFSLECK